MIRFPTTNKNIDIGYIAMLTVVVVVCIYLESTALSMLLFLIANTLHVDAGALPTDFSIQYHSFGAELVWSAGDKSKVMVGSSHYEFRLADGTVLGYPRANPMEGLLLLHMKSKEQDLLLTKEQDLEVWYGAKRIDSRAPNVNRVSNIFSSKVKTSVTSTPTLDTNPAAQGNYTVKRLTYDISRRSGLNYSNFPALIEIVAEVTYPTPLPAKSPLVLFLHGRHEVCYNPKDPNDGVCYYNWPCAQGCVPVPSHLGYRYVADILASQGFIAVSISANGITGQEPWFDMYDGGAKVRSMLIHRHLYQWARWNAVGGDPWKGLFRGKVDLNNVVLVGHSSGGEGVHRAAIDASPSDPFKIVGLVSYGPTAYGSHVTPDIHSATILPTCDGDVFDLIGQKYIDRSRDIAYSDALRSAVIVVGANNKYFNTEWTPGIAKGPASDDGLGTLEQLCDSRVIGSIRLTPQEQQIVGAAYTMALVRMAVHQDKDMLSFLDGSYVRPKSIGRAEVATSAVGGANNRLLYRPEDIGGAQGSSGMVAGECCGYRDSSTTLPKCYDKRLSSPHWGLDSNLPTPVALLLEWNNNNGATAIFTVPIELRDLSSLDSLDLRVANDPMNGKGSGFDIVIQDNLGRNATLNTSLAVINGWPGSEGGWLDRVHARTLRGYLASVPANTVDLKNIVKVFLVARSKLGKVWVFDIAASRAQVTKPVNLDLPMISVVNRNLLEGNGMQSIPMQLISDKPLKAPASIWVHKGGDWDYPEGFQINMAVGSQNATVPLTISFVGDTLYSEYVAIYGLEYSIGAMKGAVTGEYRGNYHAIEDDPIPNITVLKNNVIAVEGKSLTWKFKLSSPTDGIALDCHLIHPKTGTELSTYDVPSSWLRTHGYYQQPYSQPLSNLELYHNVYFEYGETSASFMMPIAEDRVAEKTERVVWVCSFGSQQLVLVGTVYARNTTT